MWRKNALEHPPVSVRTSTCPRSFCGSWANVSSRQVMCAALSQAEARPGRRLITPVSRSPGTVIDRRAHRVEAVAALVGRFGSFLLGVGAHQRGIDVHDHLSTGAVPGRAGQRPPPCPHPRSCLGAGFADRRDGRMVITGQGREQARHRRVRGDRPEHRRLGPDRCQISQAVTAERDRCGEIEQHLPGVMNSTRCTPRRQRHRQATLQPRNPKPSRSSNAPEDEISDSRTESRTTFGTGLRFTRGVPSTWNFLTVASPRIPSRTGTSVRYAPYPLHGREISRLGPGLLVGPVPNRAPTPPR